MIQEKPLQPHRYHSLPYQRDIELGRDCEISSKSEGKVKLADFWNSRRLSVAQGVTEFGGEPDRVNRIFSNLRKRKWCSRGTRLSREGMVISISIEFYILPEKPQKYYAWIFKIPTHGGVGGWEKGNRGTAFSTMLHIQNCTFHAITYVLAANMQNNITSKN